MLLALRCRLPFRQMQALNIRNYTNRNILTLKERGFIKNTFPEESTDERIVKILTSRPQYIYAGFDPTADSLHVGNLLILMGLLHCQRAGHHPLALLGGATGSIGDPSGRQTERPLLEQEQLVHNLYRIRKQIERIFSNHEEHFWTTRDQSGRLRPLTILNNADWYKELNLIKFISLYARHMRMGDLLSRQSVKTRLETNGMSLMEFFYQVIQAYDWLHLHKVHQCRFQLGGHDQMGNMVSGRELIEELSEKKVYAITLPLITNEEGTKFGKSAGNALWIDSEKTTPFSLYQYFVRIPDANVEELLKILTFLDLSEIAEIMEKHRKNPESREAQKKLAAEILLLVHGKDGLQKALQTTEALYTGNLEVLGKLTAGEIKDVFSGAVLCEIQLEVGMTSLDLAMKAKCFTHENDAARIITGGGFSINQQKCKNIAEIITPTIHILPNNHTLLRVGKRNYYIINWV